MWADGLALRRRNGNKEDNKSQQFPHYYTPYPVKAWHATGAAAAPPCAFASYTLGGNSQVKFELCCGLTRANLEVALTCKSK